MLIELLSSSNHVTFNIKLAQIFGLHSAIYISQLIDINEKALRKKKIDNDFFTIDRKYIQSRTTLEPTEQREIDTVLIKLNVLKKHPEKADKVSIDITTLTSIMMEPDEDLIKDISALAKQKKVKRTKEEQTLAFLQTLVVSTNPDVRQAYYNWIEAVITKDGYMTKPAVIAAQTTLDNYTNRDVPTMLKILEIGAIHGYREIQWAINTYVKDFAGNNKFIDTPPINVSTTQRPYAQPVKRARISDEVF